MTPTQNQVLQDLACFSAGSPAGVLAQLQQTYPAAQGDTLQRCAGLYFQALGLFVSCEPAAEADSGAVDAALEALLGLDRQYPDLPQLPSVVMHCLQTLCALHTRYTAAHPGYAPNRQLVQLDLDLAYLRQPAQDSSLTGMLEADFARLKPLLSNPASARTYLSSLQTRYSALPGEAARAFAALFAALHVQHVHPAQAPDQIARAYERLQVQMQAKKLEVPYALYAMAIWLLEQADQALETSLPDYAGNDALRACAHQLFSVPAPTPAQAIGELARLNTLCSLGACLPDPETYLAVYDQYCSVEDPPETEYVCLAGYCALLDAMQQPEQDGQTIAFLAAHTAKSLTKALARHLQQPEESRTLFLALDTVCRLWQRSGVPDAEVDHLLAQLHQQCTGQLQAANPE